MIVHILKLFFAGGFVAAGALQALLSSIGWLDVHGANLSAPAFMTHDATAVALCSFFGAALALASEWRRRSKKRVRV